jgi:hypothetical protein
MADYVRRQKQSTGAAAENHEADDEESEMERRMGVDRLREAEEATTGDAWDQAKVERELKRRKIVPISPAFRIVVLANPPTIKQGTSPFTHSWAIATDTSLLTTCLAHQA